MLIIHLFLHIQMYACEIEAILCQQNDPKTITVVFLVAISYFYLDILYISMLYWVVNRNQISQTSIPLAIDFAEINLYSPYRQTCLSYHQYVSFIRFSIYYDALCDMKHTRIQTHGVYRNFNLLFICFYVLFRIFNIDPNELNYSKTIGTRYDWDFWSNNEN